MNTLFPHDDRLARVALALICHPTHELHASLTAYGASDTMNRINSHRAHSLHSEIPLTPAAKGLSVATAQHVLDDSLRAGYDILIPGDSHWPPQLDDLGSVAPVALWTQGNSALLRNANLTAITGSRASTGYGEHITAQLASGLVQQRQTVVSSSSYGIDAMAHRAALSAGGHTIAVLAAGLNRLYPHGTIALLERIATHVGVLVTSEPPETAPTKRAFHRRNRLIAALSHRLVVVEAGSRSTALLTARYAHQIGRDVCAVPGPLTSATSTGTHLLIQEKTARLVTTTADILAPNAQPSQTTTPR